MLIDCENCNKKFEIEENLIPEEGRLLQCGSCNHKWFYKKIDVEKPLKLKDDVVENFEFKEPSKNINVKKEVPKKQINKKNVNIFKIFLVFIISFSALILLLDTFKSQISLIYPNIENFLNNLYQSILDVTLFFKDLIK